MLKKYNLANNALVPVETDDGKILVYINPDDTERLNVLNFVNLGTHSLSSALDPDEISRVEFQPTHTFVIWKRPANYSFQEYVLFNVSSVGLVLKNDHLVIIMTEDMTLIDEKQPCKIQTNVDMLLHVFSQTTRHFLEHLKIIKQISREIQQKINTALENQFLIQMFTLGESLTYYLNAISSNASVLTKIRNHTEKFGLTPEQIEFLDDIIIENAQCVKQAEIYSNVLSGLMDARGTLVNNNMNVILKNLTIVNTVLLPLNLIASILGMSEFSMMTRGLDWRIAYSLFFIVMCSLAWTMTVFINKYNWGQKNKSKLNLFKRRKPRAKPKPV